mmetsp:Transcript_33301/g.72704  ORF Transcript_33301/g.72704 Transcript_33301/m.72704 type:complete len:235 (+) Transcript_33301:578-1282(+)
MPAVGTSSHKSGESGRRSPNHCRRSCPACSENTRRVLAPARFSAACSPSTSPVEGHNPSAGLRSCPCSVDGASLAKGASTQVGVLASSAAVELGAERPAPTASLSPRATASALAAAACNIERPRPRSGRLCCQWLPCSQRLPRAAVEPQRGARQQQLQLSCSAPYKLRNLTGTRGAPVPRESQNSSAPQRRAGRREAPRATVPCSRLQPMPPLETRPCACRAAPRSATHRSQET